MGFFLRVDRADGCKRAADVKALGADLCDTRSPSKGEPVVRLLIRELAEFPIPERMSTALNDMTWLPRSDDSGRLLRIKARVPLC